MSRLDAIKQRLGSIQISSGTKRLVVSMVLVVALTAFGVVADPLRYLTFDRVIYLLVFGFSAIIIPSYIALLGPAIWPGRIRGPLGVLNFTLGQLAFGIGILVQRVDDDYEMCPARTSRNGIEVYIDDHWRQVNIGINKLSRLGFRKFGLLWEKPSGELKPYAVDVDVLDDEAVETRAGYEAKVPKSAREHTWLIDASKIVPSKDAGGSSIISRSETQQMRKEAQGSRLSKWSNVLGALGGLVIGSIMAYIIFAP